MAFVHYIVSVPAGSFGSFKDARAELPSSSSVVPLASCPTPTPLPKKARNLISRLLRTSAMKVKEKPVRSELNSAVDAVTNFKHILLPITDGNPYLSEGTRQAIATAAALGHKYGADITALVIDQKQRESPQEHETQLSSLRWHLSQGGFQEFGLLERLGDGSKPTAIIGEVADDLKSNIVVLSMEAVHSKHVDANLLVEFIPCPLLLLPF